jgi:hypothetical protein
MTPIPEDVVNLSNSLMKSSSAETNVFKRVFALQKLFEKLFTRANLGYRFRKINYIINVFLTKKLSAEQFAESTTLH